MKMYVFFFSFFLLLFLASITLGLDQPLTGPGGADYFHSKVVEYKNKVGARSYYLFEPDEPKPYSAPFIVFLHATYATNPGTYAAWIKHLVKKGNIVIFPICNVVTLARPHHTQNAIDSIQDALNVLYFTRHVHPELDKFALVGHSSGGILAVNIAALAEEYGLPKPKAIMAIAPDSIPMPPFDIPTPSLADLSQMPANTLLLTIVCDQDYLADDEIAKKIFFNTSKIPLENKDYITMLSDRHGLFSLTADHFAPCCMSINNILNFMSELKTNALDYYGFWKLFDALCEAAFYGENREYALGNTPQQRYMGKWRDGTPIKKLLITDNP